MNDSYYKILRKVARKHREYEVIYTTIGIWPTKSIKLNSYLVAIKTKRLLKNLLENFRKHVMKARYVHNGLKK